MPSRSDRFAGCLLAHALGDAVGAKYEGGPAERLVWKALGIGKGDLLRWTDDTLMAQGTVRSLLKCGALDFDHLAQTWADEATWRRGYGPGALKVLARIKQGHAWRDGGPAHILPGGSWGNGAAMRAAPLGLHFGADEHAMVAAVRTASSITHAHPVGIDGGVLIASATAQALGDAVIFEKLRNHLTTTEFRDRLALLQDLVPRKPEPREVASVLGNSVKADESAVTALYVALRHLDDDFESLVTFCVAMGGDTDTIAAIAGGIYGAVRGIEALPSAWLDRLEDRDAIERNARALEALSAR